MLRLGIAALLASLNFISQARAQTRIFWADRGASEGNGIYTALGDGTGVTKLISQPLPTGLAIDPDNEHIYYGNAQGSSNPMFIRRIDFDGGNPVTLQSTPSDNFALTLDLPNSKMYYTVNTNRVYSANLDGTGVTLLANIASSVRGITCGPDGNLYVAQPSGHAVWVLNKDGSSPRQLLSQTGLDPYMIEYMEGKLWVSDPSHRSLWSTSLDGSDIAVEFETGGSFIVTPRLDTVNDKWWWSDFASATNGIWCSELDGSNPTKIVDNVAGFGMVAVFEDLGGGGGGGGGDDDPSCTVSCPTGFRQVDPDVCPTAATIDTACVACSLCNVGFYASAACNDVGDDTTCTPIPTGGASDALSACTMHGNSHVNGFTDENHIHLAGRYDVTLFKLGTVTITNRLCPWGSGSATSQVSVSLLSGPEVIISSDSVYVNGASTTLPWESSVDSLGRQLRLAVGPGLDELELSIIIDGITQSILRVDRLDSDFLGTAVITPTASVASATGMCSETTEPPEHCTSATAQSNTACHASPFASLFGAVTHACPDITPRVYYARPIEICEASGVSSDTADALCAGRCPSLEWVENDCRRDVCRGIPGTDAVEAANDLCSWTEATNLGELISTITPDPCDCGFWSHRTCDAGSTECPCEGIACPAGTRQVDPDACPTSATIATDCAVCSACNVGFYASTACTPEGDDTVCTPIPTGGSTDDLSACSVHGDAHMNGFADETHIQLAGQYDATLYALDTVTVTGRLCPWGLSAGLTEVGVSLLSGPTIVVSDDVLYVNGAAVAALPWTNTVDSLGRVARVAAGPDVGELEVSVVVDGSTHTIVRIHRLDSGFLHAAVITRTASVSASSGMCVEDSTPPDHCTTALAQSNTACHSSSSAATIFSGVPHSCPTAVTRQYYELPVQMCAASGVSTDDADALCDGRCPTYQWVEDDCKRDVCRGISGTMAVESANDMCTWQEATVLGPLLATITPTACDCGFWSYSTCDDGSTECRCDGVCPAYTYQVDPDACVIPASVDSDCAACSTCSADEYTSAPCSITGTDTVCTPINMGGPVVDGGNGDLDVCTVDGASHFTTFRDLHFAYSGQDNVLMYSSGTTSLYGRFCPFSSAAGLKQTSLMAAGQPFVVTSSNTFLSGVSTTLPVSWTSADLTTRATAVAGPDSGDITINVEVNGVSQTVVRVSRMSSTFLNAAVIARSSAVAAVGTITGMCAEAVSAPPDQCATSTAQADASCHSSSATAPWTGIANPCSIIQPRTPYDSPVDVCTANGVAPSVAIAACTNVCPDAATNAAFPWINDDCLVDACRAGITTSAVNSALDMCDMAADDDLGPLLPFIAPPTCSCPVLARGDCTLGGTECVCDDGWTGDGCECEYVADDALSPLLVSAVPDASDPTKFVVHTVSDVVEGRTMDTIQLSSDAAPGCTINIDATEATCGFDGCLIRCTLEVDAETQFAVPCAGALTIEDLDGDNKGFDLTVGVEYSDPPNPDDFFTDDRFSGLGKATMPIITCAGVDVSTTDSGSPSGPTPAAPPSTDIMTFQITGMAACPAITTDGAGALALDGMLVHPEGYTVEVASVSYSTGRLATIELLAATSCSSGTCVTRYTINMASSLPDASADCDFTGVVTVGFTWTETLSGTTGPASFDINLTTPGTGWPCEPPTPIAASISGYATIDQEYVLITDTPITLTHALGAATVETTPTSLPSQVLAAAVALVPRTDDCEAVDTSSRYTLFEADSLTALGTSFDFACSPDADAFALEHGCSIDIDRARALTIGASAFDSTLCFYSTLKVSFIGGRRLAAPTMVVSTSSTSLRARALQHVDGVDVTPVVETQDDPVGANSALDVGVFESADPVPPVPVVGVLVLDDVEPVQVNLHARSTFVSHLMQTLEFAGVRAVSAQVLSVGSAALDGGDSERRRRRRRRALEGVTQTVVIYRVLVHGSDVESAVEALREIPADALVSVFSAAGVAASEVTVSSVVAGVVDPLDLSGELDVDGVGAGGAGADSDGDDASVPTPRSPGGPSWVMIGGIIGAGVVLSAIGALVLLFRNRQQRRRVSEKAKTKSQSSKAASPVVGSAANGTPRISATSLHPVSLSAPPSPVAAARDEDPAVLMSLTPTSVNSDRSDADMVAVTRPPRTKHSFAVVRPTPLSREVMLSTVTTTTSDREVGQGVAASDAVEAEDGEVFAV